MDRNSTVGMMLMMGIIMIWYLYFSPPTPPNTPSTDTKTAQNDSIAQQAKGADSLSITQKDSALQGKMADLYGDFAPLTQGTAQTFPIKTDLMQVTLTSKGGNIQAATLNKHNINIDPKKPVPLPIVANDASNEYFEEFVFQNRAIKTSDLYFTPVSAPATEVKDSTTVVMRAAIAADKFIEKSYTFRQGKYDVKYNFRLVGLNSDLKNSFYELKWKYNIPKTEKSATAQRSKTGLRYQVSDGMEEFSYSDKEEEEIVKSSVKWVSYKSQYFTNALVAEKGFRSGTFKQNTPAGEEIMRTMETQAFMDIAKSNDIQSKFTWYMGPNDYKILAAYNVGLQEQQDLGWNPVKYVNRWVMWVFDWIDSFHLNYGLIIVIFAFLVKIVVLPLTYKSFVSMAKLRVLNTTPEMKEIDTKYADDPQKQQVEKMMLYRQMGVSPFGGCVPMLLQYPVLISMLYFFPQAIELRGQPFLWATDLSSYDSIWDLGFNIPMYGDHVSLFTLMMAASTFFFTWYSQKTQPQNMGGNNMMQQQMKIMMYIMPIFLIFFLNNYASGLSWYYFVSNLLAIAQSQIIKYFVDDEKLLAKLHAVKANPDRKAGKSKIEQWLEKQQEMQKQVQQQKRQDDAPNRRERRNQK
ncbi:MAG: membrane protein insertase YidC [Bacteroidia bacterium]